MGVGSRGGTRLKSLKVLKKRLKSAIFKPFFAIFQPFLLFFGLFFRCPPPLEDANSAIFRYFC